MILIFGILAGLALGLTPFGGGLLAVPLLVAGAGLAPAQSSAAALAALALTGAVGAGDGARARALETIPALWMAAGCVPGAALGAWGMAWLPAPLWQAGFVGLAAAAAVLLWRAGDTGLRAALLLGAPRLPAGRMPVSPVPRHGLALTAAGAGAGLLGGLFSGGASLLLVPALARFAGLERRSALAGALFGITLIGVAGAGAAWAAGRAADWNLAGLFVVGAVAGFGFARRLAPRTAGRPWTRAAGMLVLAAAATLLF